MLKPRRDRGKERKNKEKEKKVRSKGIKYGIKERIKKGKE